ncbi:phosphonate C-P lyase system protein PhnG [Leucothrix arctica]|uniref:Phosphonate C-P lyase system protein PhnG n=1 Tax=Leucothrix arctica TaxID=1481894 RepID=A0A317CFP4_9GAMM|nr:phosphonate C-P lyase system protein PhnG [Leucothrix arctica]PWQ96223.1 phosphonate C-P lyase system protein PhnG [Leucothrix arctica]
MDLSQNEAARKHWISMLSQALPEELETAFEALAESPDYRWLRPAESGLAMVRARAGGTGQRFNLGETTMTRASILLGDTAGHGYLIGRNKRHAELAAVFDALLQQPSLQSKLLESVIQPIAERLHSNKKQQSQETDKTRVEFFTMVRGESD